MKRINSDRGQAAVITVMFMATLLGAVAMVLDVGSWFREQRDTQADADAAALAAAQALPADVGKAHALAAQYLDSNVAGAGRKVEITKSYTANDTVTVTVNRDADGIFSKIFGINTVNVHASAKARAGGMTAAKWVAPIVVDIEHPDLSCDPVTGEPVPLDTVKGKPVPCFGKPTVLELAHLHKPGSGSGAGSFSLINLEAGGTGNIGASTLGQWIVTGYDRYMDLGDYNAAPSALWNDSHVKDAMAKRLSGDPVLLFPIQDRIIGSGQGAEYHVVGWVAFKVTAYDANGSTGKVNGSFEEVIWEGIQSQSGQNVNYGTITIELVE